MSFYSSLFVWLARVPKRKEKSRLARKNVSFYKFVCFSGLCVSFYSRLFVCVSFYSILFVWLARVPKERKKQIGREKTRLECLLNTFSKCTLSHFRSCSKSRKNYTTETALSRRHGALIEAPGFKITALSMVSRGLRACESESPALCREAPGEKIADVIFFCSRQGAVKTSPGKYLRNVQSSPWNFFFLTQSIFDFFFRWAFPR